MGSPSRMPSIVTPSRIVFHPGKSNLYGTSGLPSPGRTVRAVTCSKERRADLAFRSSFHSSLIAASTLSRLTSSGQTFGSAPRMRTSVWSSL